MDKYLTRRQALGAVGVSSVLGRAAFAQREVTKREFMEASLENVRKNGQKFEPSTKMKFASIPNVIPFVDWDYFYLDGSLLWMPNPGQKFEHVRVPKGFVTDLASVPQGLWSFFPKSGRYAYAAVVHDYLYWFQTRPKEEADKVLLAAMEDAKVPSSTIGKFSLALQLAGGLAWSGNAEARKNGEKRILAKMPDDRLISWADWKKQPDVFEKE